MSVTFPIMSVTSFHSSGVNSSFNLGLSPHLALTCWPSRSTWTVRISVSRGPSDPEDGFRGEASCATMGVFLPVVDNSRETNSYHCDGFVCRVSNSREGPAISSRPTGRKFFRRGLSVPCDGSLFVARRGRHEKKRHKPALDICHRRMAWLPQRTERKPCLKPFSPVRVKASSEVFEKTDCRRDRPDESRLERNSEIPQR